MRHSSRGQNASQEKVGDLWFKSIVTLIILFEMGVVVMPKNFYEKEKWNAYMRKYRAKKPEVNKKICQKNYQKHKADRAEYQRRYRRKRREIEHEIKSQLPINDVTENEKQE